MVSCQILYSSIVFLSISATKVPALSYRVRFAEFWNDMIDKSNDPSVCLAVAKL